MHKNIIETPLLPAPVEVLCWVVRILTPTSSKSPPWDLGPRLHLVAGRRLPRFQHEQLRQSLAAVHLESPGWEAAPGDEWIFDESSPAWDPKGDYLYYIAVHEFHPQLSQIEFDFAANRSRGIFALALRKDVKSPFPLESDEVTIKKDGPAKTDGSKDKAKDKPPAEAKDAAAKDANKDKGIDFDGLAGRVTRVPVEADNYFGLAVKSDSLIYATGPAPYYGRDAQTKPALHIFAFKDRKDTRLVDDIGGIRPVARRIESAGASGRGVEHV